MRLCSSPPTSSYTLPIQTTTPKAHLLPPKFIRSQHFSLWALAPKAAEPSLTLSSRCLNPQSASASAKFLLVLSFRPPQTLQEQRHAFTQVPPPHPTPPTEQFITLHTLSFHPYKANSGKRKVHDSYNLW